MGIDCPDESDMFYECIDEMSEEQIDELIYLMDGVGTEKAPT